MDQPPEIDLPPKQATSWHNSIARRIRHINASKSEWYRVHRGGGSGSSSGGGGDGWIHLLIYLVKAAAGMIALYAAYLAFLWLVEVVRSLIQGVCTCVIAVVPYVLLVGIGLVVVTLYYKTHPD